MTLSQEKMEKDGGPVSGPTSGNGEKASAPTKTKTKKGFWRKFKSTVTGCFRSKTSDHLTDEEDDTLQDSSARNPPEDIFAVQRRSVMLLDPIETSTQTSLAASTPKSANKPKKTSNTGRGKKARKGVKSTLKPKEEDQLTASPIRPDSSPVPLQHTDNVEDKLLFTVHEQLVDIENFSEDNVLRDSKRALCIKVAPAAVLCIQVEPCVDVISSPKKADQPTAKQTLDKVKSPCSNRVGDSLRETRDGRKPGRRPVTLARGNNVEDKDVVTEQESLELSPPLPPAGLHNSSNGPKVVDLEGDFGICETLSSVATEGPRKDVRQGSKPILRPARMAWVDTKDEEASTVSSPSSSIKSRQSHFSLELDDNQEPDDDQDEEMENISPPPSPVRTDLSPVPVEPVEIVEAKLFVKVKRNLSQIRPRQGTGSLKLLDVEDISEDNPVTVVDTAPVSSVCIKVTPYVDQISSRPRLVDTHTSSTPSASRQDQEEHQQEEPQFSVLTQTMYNILVDFFDRLDAQRTSQ